MTEQLLPVMFAEPSIDGSTSARGSSSDLL
jgi:hypothetical protein